MLFIALTVTIIVIRKSSFLLFFVFMKILILASYVAISYCLFYSLYVFMKQVTQHEQNELNVYIKCDHYFVL